MKILHSKLVQNKYTENCQFHKEIYLNDSRRSFIFCTNPISYVNARLLQKQLQTLIMLHCYIIVK